MTALTHVSQTASVRLFTALNGLNEIYFLSFLCLNTVNVERGSFKIHTLYTGYLDLTLDIWYRNNHHLLTRLFNQMSCFVTSKLKGWLLMSRSTLKVWDRRIWRLWIDSSLADMFVVLLSPPSSRLCSMFLYLPVLWKLPCGVAWHVTAAFRCSNDKTLKHFTAERALVWSRSMICPFRHV